MYNYNFLDDQWYKMIRDNSYRNMNNNGMNNKGMNNNIGANFNAQTNNMNMPALFTPDDGYNKGNMFADLYNQYKNYKPVILKANNERDRMLLELSQIAFAAHELNLYLDLNPNDNSMITLFNDYRERANELERQYEAKYGPLNISSNSLNQTPFAWEQNNWPWEERFNV